MSLLCCIFGHRLQTSVHAREPTLWCSRCKTVQWVMVRGFIVRPNYTMTHLANLGLIHDRARTHPQGQGEKRT